jgi:hypothetical protein
VNRTENSEFPLNRKPIQMSNIKDMRSYVASVVFFSFLYFTASPSIVIAQSHFVRGKVVDENKAPLVGVLVLFVDLNDSSKSRMTPSDLDGSFCLANVAPGTYRLELRAVGHRNFSTTLEIATKDVDIGTVVMTESAIPLHGVTVEGRFPSAVQNGDTTEYQAAAVKVNRDATMEDLLSKLPGMMINNGTVTVGGETVQRVLVDGRPYFGDDPTLAIRSLPAEVIEKIQVFDQMSDQAQFTGFDDGQSIKVVNVITKRKGRRLDFGKFVAGYGDDNGRYDAAANMNTFNGDTRLSFLGSSNNVNQQDFSTQDILGVISSRNSILVTPGVGRAFGGEDNVIMQVYLVLQVLSVR